MQLDAQGLETRLKLSLAQDHNFAGDERSIEFVQLLAVATSITLPALEQAVVRKALYLVRQDVPEKFTKETLTRYAGYIATERDEFADMTRESVLHAQLVLCSAFDSIPVAWRRNRRPQNLPVQRLG